MSDYVPYETHHLYDAKRFSWRQINDCYQGSSAIKEANLIYLPMPSAMWNVEGAPSYARSPTSYSNDRSDYQREYVPWAHSNPAYQAYLQRARFPDMVANAVRSLLGMATKGEHKIELPRSIEYLEKNSDSNGHDLSYFYSKCLKRNMVDGKGVIVADINQTTGQFFLKIYTAKENINWDVVNVDGEDILTSCSFALTGDMSFVKEFFIHPETQTAHVRYWKDGKQSNDDGTLEQNLEIELSYMGKTFNFLPIVFFGSEDNRPEPGVVPLSGIADCAISIYQEDADLRQAHFMTCNPTLFVFGIGQNETPTVVGSTVVVGIKNPAASASYPSTDTSALEHIRSYVQDLYVEAATYGAHFISPLGQRESGEALSMRSAMNGTNLVHICNMTSAAIEKILEMISEFITGSSDVVFEANIEFSEMILTAQDITALVSSWLQGAIDHETLLDNMRDAGYIAKDKTNDEIMDLISVERPAVDPERDNVDNLDGGE